MNSSQPAKAVSAYEQADPVQPDSMSALLFSYVAALRSTGQGCASEQALRTAEQVDSRDAKPWYQSAEADLKAGRAAEALQQIRKAVALEPDSPGGYTDLGTVLNVIGQFQEAEKALRTALAMDPYDATA